MIVMVIVGVIVVMVGVIVVMMGVNGGDYGDMMMTVMAILILTINKKLKLHLSKTYLFFS